MTRAVNVGGVQIGGGAPIVVQSMTNTDTTDIRTTLDQIGRLEVAGCEIVRVAVPDQEAARALPAIVEGSPLPVVADIHFDHRLAFMAIEAHVAKLRLNPGNITDEAKITQVVQSAGRAGIPIRVGANSGSLAPRFLDDGHPTADGMVGSALDEVRLLETLDFRDIVISLKGTDVPMTIAAYRRMADEVDYPLHIGITEAGTRWEGSVRSAVGLGILLEQGIGDTLRVSLSGDPVTEVRAAYAILRALNLRNRGMDFRVCPTCGRTQIDLTSIAETVQDRLSDVSAPLTVAVMGCIVNGIGEAKEADVALVGGVHTGTLYAHGEIMQRSVPEAELTDRFTDLVRDTLGQERGHS